MAGIDGKKIQECKTAAECQSAAGMSEPAIVFAHAFGETGGYGSEKSEAYKALVAAKGKGHAKSVHALCRYMMWGGRTGNTIQGFLCGSLCCNPRPSSFCGFVPFQILFELIITLYYSFLFLIAIPIVGKILSKFPKIPNLASGMIGCVLVTVAGSHIAPMGIIGLLTFPLQFCCNKAPPKKTPKGCKASKQDALTPSDGSSSADPEAPPAEAPPAG